MLIYLKKLYEKEKYESISNHLYLSKTINIINCAQEGGSLIDIQEVVKKKMRICFNIKATQKIEFHDNNV